MIRKALTPFLGELLVKTSVVTTGAAYGQVYLLQLNPESEFTVQTNILVG